MTNSDSTQCTHTHTHTHTHYSTYSNTHDIVQQHCIQAVFLIRSWLTTWSILSTERVRHISVHPEWLTQNKAAYFLNIVFVMHGLNPAVNGQWATGECFTTIIISLYQKHFWCPIEAFKETYCPFLESQQPLRVGSSCKVKVWEFKAEEWKFEFSKWCLTAATETFSCEIRFLKLNHPSYGQKVSKPLQMQSANLNHQSWIDLHHQHNILEKNGNECSTHSCWI